MLSAATRLLHLACLTALVLACFGSVLFWDQQFDYRDAGHFYYPLYELVQKEWNAGRLPLWEPEENGGMPLLGNPTAAVLYPGKLIYFALPYPWAARIYTIAHVLLAAGGIWLLLRHWGVSATGRMVGALSYAFGMPVLFQYCNIVFLVGAAWLPLGVRAVDRWLRLGRRWGIVELALVLALQTLGGDPETAYLLGVAAGGYAWMLCRPTNGPSGRWPLPLAMSLIVGAVWVLAVLAAAAYVPLGLKFADAPKLKDSLLREVLLTILSARFWRGLAAGTWLVIAVGILFARGGGRGRPAPDPRFQPRAPHQPFPPTAAEQSVLGRFRRGLVGLVVAALLATALMGLQLLPTLEYTRLTLRAVSEIHESFAFSVEPLRLLELIWPGVLGRTRQENTLWLPTLLPGMTVRLWLPSLYLGAATVLLAWTAWASRGGPPWRGWLAAIAVVSVLGALGLYGSPLWLARYDPAAAALLGPHDPEDLGELRRDGYLVDGFGSPYWLMAQVLPGFRSFRYPAKLFTFTALALSGLAALGWDQAVAGRTRGARGFAAFGSAAGAAALALVVLKADHLRAFWTARLRPEDSSVFGPFQPDAALGDIQRGLAHGSLVLLAALALMLLAPRRPRLAGAGIVGLLALDLALANAPWVLTCEQALFDSKPEVLEIIEQAERASGSTEPYRIHRMPIWEPAAWRMNPSRDRVRDFVLWERNTIQPKYAIPYRAHYTLTQGVTELYDYWFFFAPFDRKPSARLAQTLHIPEGKRVIYYPRRGYDLWNTKYFVLPWAVYNTEHRGIYTLLPDTDPIVPTPNAFDGPDGEQRRRQWETHQDWRVCRNRRAFPRAWVVHEARVVKPIRGLRREDRQKTMEEIIYEGDELWNDPSRIFYDPRQIVWIETDDPRSILRFQTGGPPSDAEKPRITRYEPTRVEIDVSLDRPGFLVLADVDYPGWTLVVDGAQAPILRANHLMRGAALTSGRHHLVFRYQPDSVKHGAVLSALGLIALLGTMIWCLFQSPTDPEAS